MILEQGGLGGGGFEPEDFIGTRKGNPTLLSALEITFEDQVGFVDFLKSAGLFTDGGGEGVKTGGSAFPFSGQGLEEAFIHFIQTVLIDFEHFESGDGGRSGGGALGAGEGVVTDPAEEVIGDAGGTSATASDFGGGGRFEFYFEKRGGALHDGGEILDGVVVEPVGHAKAGAEGGAEESSAGGGPDESEAGEVEADGAGGGALIDDDIDAEIFHGGIEVLFDDFGEAMNFVDEEDIAFLQASEQAGEVARFFDGGAGGGADGGVHFGSKNVGEGSFPEAGRSAEEKMIEGLGAGAGGVDEDAETVFEFGLAGEIGEAGGAEGLFDSVAGGGVEFFKGLSGHRMRMAEGGKFESGKVGRYAHRR